MKTINLEKVEKAESFIKRSLGVIGWEDFGERNGLLITKTNSVHTFFVRFDLDLIFLDKDMKILKVIENFHPFAISPIVWKASHVLEMPRGSVKKFDLKTSDIINLI